MYSKRHIVYQFLYVYVEILFVFTSIRGCVYVSVFVCATIHESVCVFVCVTIHEKTNIIVYLLFSVETKETRIQKVHGGIGRYMGV